MFLSFSLSLLLQLLFAVHSTSAVPTPVWTATPTRKFGSGPYTPSGGSETTSYLCKVTYDDEEYVGVEIDGVLGCRIVQSYYVRLVTTGITYLEHEDSYGWVSGRGGPKPSNPIYIASGTKAIAKVVYDGNTIFGSTKTDYKDLADTNPFYYYMDFAHLPNGRLMTLIYDILLLEVPCEAGFTGNPCAACAGMFFCSLFF